MRALRYAAARRFNLLDVFIVGFAYHLGWSWEAVVVIFSGSVVSTVFEMAVEKV